MWSFAVIISEYFGVVFILALILEHLVPQRIADAFAVKLIDFSGVIRKNSVDTSISRCAMIIMNKFNMIYGIKYFGTRQFIISSMLVFLYCTLFAFIERDIIGFHDSTVLKQLKFWFVPSLLADICSVNVTRWLLGKTTYKPKSYISHVAIDLIFVLLFFYISYSIAIVVLYLKAPWLGHIRIIFHPFYMVEYALYSDPMPIIKSMKLTVLMALTTLIPSLVHFIFITFGLFLRYALPLLTQISTFFVNRVVSLDRHPIAMLVVMIGIYLTPLFIYFQL